MKEYCGLFGIYGNKKASMLTYLGLYALQHRGEESCGIVSSDAKRIWQHRAMGTIADTFNQNVLKKLKGHIAIGHVRYSTTGSSTIKNVQPFTINFKKGSISIAHNGNLTNSRELRDGLETAGSIMQTSMDSELILHLLVKAKSKGIKDGLAEVLPGLKGAYSLLILTDNLLIGARDPYGFRPLCVGKVGSSYVLASETCALDLVGAKYVRDVEPGEIVFIGKNGIEYSNSYISRAPTATFLQRTYILQEKIWAGCSRRSSR